MKKKPLFLSILISIAAAIAMMSLLPAASAATGYIRGDANGDGKVNVCDVTAIQRHVAEVELLTGACLFNADVNGDGEVTIDDATHLLRYLAEFDGIVLGKQPTA